MKVSHYISILILACLLMGIGSSAMIYFNGYQKATAQHKLQSLTLKHMEAKNIESLMGQWLINLDLFLTNKQTYLYKSLVKQSQTLNQLIEQVSNQDLSEVKFSIDSVIALCDRLKLATDIHNEQQWDYAINQTDKFTDNIDIPTSKLLQEFEDQIAVTKNEILQISATQQSLLIVLLCLFLIFTATILFWTQKVVIRPLSDLTALTQKGNIRAEDFQIEGPQEVAELSKQMGNYILALVKAKEVALAETAKSKYANARIRNIMETAGDAIVCADINGNILEMNESFRQLAEININEKYSSKLTRFIPSFELNLIDDDFSCMLISFVEATLYTQNQQEIPVEISTSSFHHQGNRLFTIIIRDITERAELTEKLLQAQKLESIGLLAAGIAHEINTPAQYIMDYNRFIKEGFESINDFIKATHDIKHTDLENMASEMNLDFYEEEIPNAIKGSLYGLEQISKIVKSVKGFTHPEQAEKTYFSINDIIKDTVNVSRNEWKYDAEIELQLDSELPDIKCFPVRLNQVFLNLLVNSAQAIHEQHKNNQCLDKGKISISTSFDEENIIIHVKDSGSGIPKDIQNKIFDPFFTTKEVGVGTGQGLALSYDFIVLKHNGTINVESQPGEGAEFIITIPLETQLQKAS